MCNIRTNLHKSLNKKYINGLRGGREKMRKKDELQQKYSESVRQRWRELAFGLRVQDKEIAEKYKNKKNKKTNK